MTYANFQRDIELYLRSESTKGKHMIKMFTNSSILEFMRLRDWKMLQVSETITLDGSFSYALDVTNLTNYFLEEIGLFLSNGQELEKFEYNYYIQLADKTRCYAILGESLHVTGSSGDVKLLFNTPGALTDYPILANNAVEPLILKYYPDVLKHKVVLDMLDFMEDEQYERETIVYNKKMTALIRGEKRMKNQGKPKIIMRNSNRYEV